jgi:hypothetical protein
MFGLFTRARRRRVPTPSIPRRPVLEGLEWRWAPAVVTGSDPTDTMQTQTSTDSGTSAPEITQVSYVENADGSYTIFGTVSAANLQTVQVQLGSSIPELNGQLLSCDANGCFSVTVMLNGTETDGSVYLTAFSDPTQMSCTDEVVLPVAAQANSAPEITSFQVVRQDNGSYVFSGKISYSGNTEGLVVQFGGNPVSLNGQSTTCDANGNFSFAIYLNGTPSDNGTVTAVVMSPDGPSETAEVVVRQN